MRSNTSLVPLTVGAITAFVLSAAVFLAPDIAGAGDDRVTNSAPCNCLMPKSWGKASGAGAGSNYPEGAGRSTRSDKSTAPKAVLDDSDEVATLESVQFALSEVADGGSYVWQRSNGHLSGIVSPTSSFKDRAGNICRHVVLVLTTEVTSRKTEGVACRLANGRWQLDG